MLRKRGKYEKIFFISIRVTRIILETFELPIIRYIIVLLLKIKDVSDLI
jgi:hypothetical protein